MPFIRKRGNSWSLEERYRCPKTGKVKSRYLGTLRGPGSRKRLPPKPRELITAGLDWEEIEKQEIARMEREELEHKMLLSRQQVKFHQATGLLLPIGPLGQPTPVEKGQTDTRKDFGKATGWDLDEVIARGADAQGPERREAPEGNAEGNEPEGEWVS